MRNDAIGWDDYFMSLAKLSAMRSKDPETQVGACIVSEDKKVLGLGYNGFPYGCEDNEFPWNKDGDFINSKYAYVVHAELNVILNSTNKVEGSTIYVTLFPCNECAKSIIQSGIKHIVYECDKYIDRDFSKAAKSMLISAGVSIRKSDEIFVKLTKGRM